MLISNVEEIKVNYVCVLKDMVSMEDSIEVFSVGGCFVWVMLWYILVEVIEFCYQELFELVYKEIKVSGFDE